MRGRKCNSLLFLEFQDEDKQCCVPVVRVSTVPMLCPVDSYYLGLIVTGTVSGLW